MTDALQFLSFVQLPDWGNPDFETWRQILVMAWFWIGVGVAVTLLRGTCTNREKAPVVRPEPRTAPDTRNEAEKLREDLWWRLFALRQVKRFLPPNEVAKLPASIRLKKYRDPKNGYGFIRIRKRRRTIARRSDAILIELERRITARNLKKAGGVVVREPVVMPTRAMSKRAVVVEKR